MHRFHIPLFGALVLFSSGTLYLVTYVPEAKVPDTKTSGPEAQPAERLLRLSRRAEEEVSQTPETLCIAIVTVFASSAVIMLSMTVCALLTKSLDKPKTLRVGNRWVRLAPRMAATLVLATIWLHHFESPSAVLGLLLLIIWFVGLWEYFAGMEKDAKFFEPKRNMGLTPVVSDEERVRSGR